MGLLDEIAAARTPIQERAQGYADKLIKHGYSYDNAEQAASRNGMKGWNGRWFAADKERLRQLDLLSQAISDPSWTAQLDREVGARRKSGNLQAEAGYRGAEDSRAVAGGQSGTAGGSWDAVVAGQNAQDLAMTKARVAQQVDELRAAGVQNLDDMGRQLLQRAVAGGQESEAMGVSAQGSQVQHQANVMSAQNQDQYHALLANSIAGFLNNTVTPGIQGGFQSADRWNQQQRNNYMDARDSGAYTGSYQDWAANNGGTRSWWGF